MTRIERVTSPLPRECSTTEPHGHRHGFGARRAGRQTGVDVCRPSHSLLERETGIEPVSLAWKAKVLPLNYSRPGSHQNTRLDLQVLVEEAGFEPAYAMRADLQSAAFNHSATPPEASPQL